MDYPGKVITKTQVTPTQTSASGNWTLDDQAAAIKNNNWPVALVPNPISKSLRFNPADTAYLSRTFGTPTNNKKWTMSGWMKRSAINDGNYNTLFSRYVDGNNFMRVDLLGDNLRMYQYKSANDVLLRSTLVLRDPSAWYHFVVVYDSDNATSSNRVLFYINNTQITSFSSSTYPSSGSSSIWNTSGGATHQIGTFNANGVGEAFSGYMTEMNFVDGQALTPSDFGLTNPQTGQWIPKKYTGTYGTNGFYLNFKDATSTTTLGYDYSGNANNWTTNNFSVTAGVGNDSLTDVPTPWIAYNTTGDVGGVVRGNYATLNPVYKSASQPTISNGNLTVAPNAGTYQNAFSTIGVTTGKWYAEVVVTGDPNSANMIGVSNATQLNYLTNNADILATGSGGTGYGYFILFGTKYSNGSSTTYGNTIASGDIVGIALDLDNGKIWFSKNGTWQASGDPAAGTNAAFTGIASDTWSIGSTVYSGGSTSFNYNFGQRPFAYTPPAGFRSLCTTNLPATAIGFGLTNQSDDYFTAYLYTADGTSPKSRTGIGFAPDFLWFKDRTSSFSHALYDTVRGTNKGLQTNTTAAENTYTLLTAFGSDGFTTSDDGTVGNLLNYSTDNYVTWAWKAAGSTVSNTAGTITSTVSANTTSGFSIVTYTGTGANATVGHGLGVAPSMIIVKNRSSAQTWRVYSSVIGATQYLNLNATTAAQTSSIPWNNTAPTSTVFSVGTDDATNKSSENLVAYCFAAVPGYSAFGSYTGNNSADGPFIYLGFRPAFVLIKTSNTTQWWTLLDNKRDTYNVATLGLSPNSSDSETTFNTNRGPHNMDFVSNGLKIRTDNSAVNGTNTFIYAAFAEYPFQFANAR